MFFVKDLVKLLRKDVTIIIDLGPDSYNCGHCTPYREKEHGNLTVEEIFILEENVIGIKVL